jgi:hypothetical protein
MRKDAVRKVVDTRKNEDPVAAEKWLTGKGILR